MWNILSTIEFFLTKFAVVKKLQIVFKPIPILSITKFPCKLFWKMGRYDDMIAWCPLAPPPREALPKLLVYCPHRKLISQKQKNHKIERSFKLPTKLQCLKIQIKLMSIFEKLKIQIKIISISSFLHFEKFIMCIFCLHLNLRWKK